MVQAAMTQEIGLGGSCLRCTCHKDLTRGACGKRQHGLHCGSGCLNQGAIRCSHAAGCKDRPPAFARVMLVGTAQSAESVHELLLFEADAGT